LAVVDTSPLEFVIEPLTAQAFKPFGQVTDIASGERRNRIAGAYERTDQANEPRLWISTVHTAVQLPLSIQKLERHPYSAQSFMPINGCAYVVVVCQSDGLGQPVLASLRGFIAAPGQGVTYSRNVWHQGLSVLQAPAYFVVCMSFAAEGGDDIFMPLGVPVQLVSKGAHLG
jgi:ureidoglycolate lyase